MLLAASDVWRAENGMEFAATTTVDAELTFAADKVTGIIATVAVPGSQPYDVMLHIPGKHVAHVEDSTGIISRQAKENSIRMTLRPGEHYLEITLE